MRIGTVAGIQIRVHATFFLLVALVALAATTEGGPSMASSLGWLAALFACVVAHELGHSMVARRNGIPTLEIELLPIGGVSKLARYPEDPRVELRIALAGPIVSVVLGVAFAFAAVAAGVEMWPPTLYGGGFLARLAWVNLLLAAFNLLPALPLDGGRVFRSMLEQHTGRERATRLAARVARLVAIGMIAAGVMVNVWLVLIGVFVYFASSAEEKAARIHERVKDRHVSDVMIESPICVSPDTPVAHLLGVMRTTAQRDFPVVTADGAYVGLVRAAVLLHAAPDARAGSVADSVPPLAPGDPLETSGLLSGELSVTAVVTDGRVVGLVRAADAGLLTQ
jgi:stage IV sporulation protein FB